jgi:hypothetical protein
VNKLQRFRNDKESLICEKPECQSLINIGELAVIRGKYNYKAYYEIRGTIKEIIELKVKGELAWGKLRTRTKFTTLGSYEEKY